MTDLTGRTAIVTGASRGIGAATAKRIGAAGAHVAVHYGGSAEAACGVVAEIEAAGGTAFAVQADLAASNGVDKLFAETDRVFGREGEQTCLDIFVNNAGIGNDGVDSRFGKVTPEHFDRLFAVNVKAAALAVQAAAERICDGGRIVTISSVSGRVPQSFSPVYASTKAALNSLTRSAAQALGIRRITVNAIAPGAVDTEFIAQLRARPGFDENAVRHIWMGRLGRPEDIAGAAMMLLSDDAGWVTGQVIEASGGLD
jgi:NAD(P)-dependent dehydrogenase (short-subunit alcohol dehydrogenase family)